MANENSRDPTIPKPQSIPLAKIHDLSGIPISRQPDKSYGGLVTSIQAGGVKEPVILRLREDGEYQLVTGYRRMRASELAKKQEIPALVYEMSLQEAIRYHGLANGKPAPPIPGKLVEPGAKDEKQKKSDIKGPENPTTGEKPKEAKPPEAPKGPELPTGEKKEAPVTGPAAKGPAGTAISQVLDERLTPPDEKAKRDIPNPKENEAFFILLHPAYLEKSKYNTISVDTRSEDYLELKKSIELNGVKDPVLARIGDEGTLEILSGQRRHLIATELNYPVPTIIQKISDADAKILVADGNLHRPHISMYDLSRSLRMKMEGMKQKAGRKKKGTFKAEELDSDEKLAQEMGMKVSKLNRIIRLSEATKDVCDRVDDNSLPLSIASAISFLKPDNQDEVLHLSDLGYKITTERVERMKKTEKAGKLNEQAMRDILEDKDLAPKQTTPPPAPQPSAPQPPAPPNSPSAPPPIPPSPDVKPEQTAGAPPSTPEPATPAGPSAPENTSPPAGPAANVPPEEKTPFKGEQERPEYTKVILAGDRLRKYFPDVSMTPREIEESVYDALEERRQRQMKAQQKEDIFKKNAPKR